MWLIADLQMSSRDALLALLDGMIAELAATGSAQAFVEHAERREELARITLASLDLLPKDEDAHRERTATAAPPQPRRRRPRAAGARGADPQGRGRISRQIHARMTAMPVGDPTDHEHYPTLTAAGRALLRRMTERPATPL